jgi:uncharacterized protein
MNFSTKFPLPVIITSKNKGTEGEGQCDCACPSPLVVSPSITNRQNFNTQLISNPLTQIIPLDFNYKALFIPSSDTISVVNNSVIKLLDTFRNPLAYTDLPTYWEEAWGDQLLRTLDELGERRFLLSPDTLLFSPPTNTNTPAKIIAWLHVTNKCNLQCRYCYINKTEEVMNINVGQAAIEAVLRSAIIHGFSAVKLKYAGGEPTLNFPLIISLQEYARQLAKDNDLELDGVILSNGVGLTSRMLDDMIANNLRLMISLDGLGASHDSQRMFANGTGSFKAVYHTLNLALEKGLVPDISITVTGQNVDTLAETVAWILDRELPFSINFYRENEISMTYEDLQLSAEKIIRGMQTVFKVIKENLPHRNLLPSLVDRANLAVPHSHACGVGANYMVIDHHGHISKCQMQAKNPVTTIDAIDPLSLIRADKRGIHNIHVDEKEGCRECKWRYWCAGGCPLITYKATGRYDVKSPNCDIYKLLYPDVIKLEGLRLLKYHND